MTEAIRDFFGELKHAVRSLVRAKGLTVTVVLTLALGIGANAAIFALVRGVLLRPLVNRDEDRLIYIRQTREGHRRREHDVLGSGNPGSARAGQELERVRRFLEHRLHHGGPRRAA